MDNRVYRPEDPMYIKIHNFDDTVTWESPHHDANLETLFDRFRGLLVTIGFPEESINRYIIELGSDLQSDLLAEEHKDDLP